MQSNSASRPPAEPYFNQGRTMSLLLKSWRTVALCAAVSAADASLLQAAGVKLDFVTQLGGEGEDTVNGIARDTAGNIYVAASSFLAKLDPNGQPVYARRFGVHRIALAPDGSVFISRGVTV